MVLDHKVTAFGEGQVELLDFLHLGCLDGDATQVVLEGHVGVSGFKEVHEVLEDGLLCDGDVLRSHDVVQHFLNQVASWFFIAEQPLEDVEQHGCFVRTTFLASAVYVVEGKEVAGEVGHVVLLHVEGILNHAQQEVEILQEFLLPRLHFLLLGFSLLLTQLHGLEVAFFISFPSSISFIIH